MYRPSHKPPAKNKPIKRVSGREALPSKALEKVAGMRGKFGEILEPKRKFVRAVIPLIEKMAAHPAIRAIIESGDEDVYLLPILQREGLNPNDLAGLRNKFAGKEEVIFSQPREFAIAIQEHFGGRNIPLAILVSMVAFLMGCAGVESFRPSEMHPGAVADAKENPELKKQPWEDMSLDTRSNLSREQKLPVSVNNILGMRDELKISITDQKQWDELGVSQSEWNSINITNPKLAKEFVSDSIHADALSDISALHLYSDYNINWIYKLYGIRRLKSVGLDNFQAIHCLPYSLNNHNDDVLIKRMRLIKNPTLLSFGAFNSIIDVSERKLWVESGKDLENSPLPDLINNPIAELLFNRSPEWDWDAYNIGKLNIPVDQYFQNRWKYRHENPPDEYLKLQMERFQLYISAGFDDKDAAFLLECSAPHDHASIQILKGLLDLEVSLAPEPHDRFQYIKIAISIIKSDQDKLGKDTESLIALHDGGVKLTLNEYKRCRQWCRDYRVSRGDMLKYAQLLFRTRGFRHFYRFRPTDIPTIAFVPEPTKENITADGVGLLFLPKTDWNGAFCGKGSREAYSRIINGKIPVFVFEPEKESEMFDAIELIGNKYGKISILVIGGHGYEASISLGDEDPRLHDMTKSEEYALDLGDSEDIVKRNLAKFLHESLVWLYSCSTAKGGEQENNIAKMLAETFQPRKLVASRTPIGISDTTLEFEDGKLTNVLIKDSENTVVFAWKIQEKDR